MPCEREATESGVTNSLALVVRIVLISAPFFLKSLMVSRLLYAEIPPHIIKRTFYLTHFLFAEIRIPIALKLQDLIS